MKVHSPIIRSTFLLFVSEMEHDAKMIKSNSGSMVGYFSVVDS